MIRLRCRGLGILFFMLCTLPCVRAANAQADMQGLRETARPSFYLDYANFRAALPNQSKLEVFLKVQYDELQFIRQSDETFQAVYEVAVALAEDDRDEFQIAGRVWRDTVRVAGFETTNSRRKVKMSRAGFELAPGNYRLTVTMTDLDTRGASSRTSKVVLRDFSKAELQLSDILIAEAVENGVPLPQVAAPRHEASELFAYFEIYDEAATAPYEVSYALREAKHKKILAGKLTVAPSGKTTPAAIRLPNAELPHGSYHLRVEVNGASSSERRIVLSWEGVPTTAVDLEEAIAQLRYVAPKAEFAKLKKTPEPLRREAFLRFWRSKDPTPGTEQNELMTEYYHRVQYANAAFHAVQPGWKTDMGMVYILLGPPSDIHRDPYNQDISFGEGRTVKAYEVWQYNSINREFIFIDESGYGEYRLLYPLNVEQYIR